MAAALARSHACRVLLAALACVLLWTAVLACAVVGPRWHQQRPAQATESQR